MRQQKLKILRLKIELWYPEDFIRHNKPEEMLWFLEEILGDSEQEGLVLYSNNIGDDVGKVKVLEVDDISLQQLIDKQRKLIEDTTDEDKI